MKRGIIQRSERLYDLILKLYPEKFTQQFGDEMRFVFSESLQDAYAQASRKGIVVFWGRTVMDAWYSLVYEHARNWKEQSTMISGIISRPNLAALLGFLLMLPFIGLNAVVGNRVEPFFSWIRPTAHTSAQELVLLFTGILLIPVGALIAGLPMLQKGADGKRRFYLVNGILAALLVVIFVLLAFVLGEEIYRCDILQIPNCD